MSVIVWLISILFSVQAFVFRTERQLVDQVTNRTIRHCSWDFPGKDNTSEYMFWLNVQFTSKIGFSFLLPLLVIGYCYLSIFIFLRRRRKAHWQTQGESIRNGAAYPRKKVARPKISFNRNKFAMRLNGLNIHQYLTRIFSLNELYLFQETYDEPFTRICIWKIIFHSHFHYKRIRK